jgi:hypothetical protein
MDCQRNWQLESSGWWAQREREKKRRERSFPVRSDLSHILPLPFLIRQCVEQADVMLQDKLWSSTTVKLETVVMMMTMKMMIPTHNFRFVCRVNHHCRAFFLSSWPSHHFSCPSCVLQITSSCLLVGTYLTDWLAGSLDVHTKQEVQTRFALTDKFC